MQAQKTMESFLNASKTALSDLSSYKKIRVVLGNQTCDLDSAVCTLVQGFSEYVNAKKEGQCDLAVIPVLNIPEKEFCIKTEVVYWLKFHNVPVNLLTFRDQINLQEFQSNPDKKLELVLVDHHTLPSEDISLKSSVITIIDHRQLDLTCPWPETLLNIKIVGSCASLVAYGIIEKNPLLLDTQLASLLRGKCSYVANDLFSCIIQHVFPGPILVDTYNMSPEGYRVTATDIDVLNKLEHLGKLTNDRTEIFNKIMDAKTDISGLTVEELMLKDLKVAGDVPIAVFPILVENLLRWENAKEMIEKFGVDRNFTVIILIGLDMSDGHMSRDMAVFSISYNQLGDEITQALISSSQPYLNADLFLEIQEERYYIRLYKLGNLEVTRKQILPIVLKTALLHKTKQNIKK